MVDVNKKQAVFSIDLPKLKTAIAQEDPFKNLGNNNSAAKSTIITLGLDPRIAPKQPITAPAIYSVQILKDRFENPFVNVKWRMDRRSVNAGNLAGFDIHKRRLQTETSPEESTLVTNASPVVSPVVFDKVSRKMKRAGKFSEEKKALYSIKRGNLPLQILNQNLDTLDQVNRTSTQSKKEEDQLGATTAVFSAPSPVVNFSKIGYVDYSLYIAEEKKKFEEGITVDGLIYSAGGTKAFSQDRDFVEFSFFDKQVSFDETLEYKIIPVAKKFQDCPTSNVVRVTIIDSSGISAPSIYSKQLSSNEIQISVTVNSGDDIVKVFLFRKSEDEVLFSFAQEKDLSSETVVFSDTEVIYGKTYTYRVFSQNIHGVVSPPSEITVFSSTSKVTRKSRSNNLKSPIFIAIQDQNSDNVKVVISPNDPKIDYYELKRKDTTISEKGFRVPSKLETNYGGDGWESNKFLVSKTLEQVSSTSFVTKMQEIVFIDDTVQRDHYYDYMVQGFDFFGNSTNPTFASILTKGKKSLRSPVNLRFEVLRGFPFRAKLMWDDDNFSLSPEQKSKLRFQIQRRKVGETKYESFPLTENTFIYDEVANLDFLAFHTEKSEDTEVPLPNSSQVGDLDKIQKLRRSYPIPDFLIQNSIYFYRVAVFSAADEGGTTEESNFSEELEVRTLANLSEPLNFQVFLDPIVEPLVAVLSWRTDELAARPDRWIIERKTDNPYEAYKTIGVSYLEERFIDVGLKKGYNYLYRIKSVDISGRESAYFEASVAT